MMKKFIFNKMMRKKNTLNINQVWGLKMFQFKKNIIKDYSRLTNILFSGQHPFFVLVV